MIIVGIDPGKKGALALINTYSFKDTYAITMENNTPNEVYQYLAELKGGETHGRMQRLSRHKINIVRPDRPLVTPQDTSMEIWMEEPSVIHPRNKGSDEKSKLSAIMATKSLARCVGLWHGLAIALDTPITFVNPRVWQSKVGLKRKDGKKAENKNFAKNIFKHLTRKSGLSKITDSTADALLIALYGYIQYVPRERWPASVSNNVP